MTKLSVFASLRIWLCCQLILIDHMLHGHMAVEWVSDGDGGTDWDPAGQVTWKELGIY